MGVLDTIAQAISLPIDWQVLTPELIVLLFAILVAIMGARGETRQTLRQFALVGLGASFLFTLGTVMPFEAPDDALACGDGPSDRGVHAGVFSLRYIDWSACSAADGHPIADAFAVTEFSQIFKLLFLGVAFLAVLAANQPLRGRSEEDTGEFYALVLFAALGMMVVASAKDIFVLFLGIETASFSSYLLAGIKRDRQGAEASLKYFLVGAISSAMGLFAISLLYGMVGSTNIAAIGDALTIGGSYDAASIMVIVFLLIAFGFKISSIPVQNWAPDVYYGAPTQVVGMLATASKAMGFIAVFHVFLVGLAGVSANWELAVALIAMLTMFLGNLVALRQDSIRRMLAYSSIAQAGYLLIAVAVVGAYDGRGGDPSIWALGGAILHLFVNAAMKLGAFLLVGALLFLGLSDRIGAWKGLGKRAPFAAFAMTIFLLSMAGLPPFGGFVSKFILFSGAIDAGVTQGLGWLIWLAVFAVLNSAISLFYYLRVIRTMYVDEGDTQPLRLESGTTIAVFVCMALVLLIGFYPDWFIDFSMGAAADLLAP